MLKTFKCGLLNTFQQNFFKINLRKCSYLEDNISKDEIDEVLRDEFYTEYKNSTLGSNVKVQENAIVIQPWIRKGPHMLTNTTPQLMLDETVTLAQTIPNFRVVKKDIFKLDSLMSRQVLGRGNLEKTAQAVHSMPEVNCVVFGVNMLTGKQQTCLEEELGVRVYDRYGIVLRIFSERACSPEARIQTALAEIPYIRSRLRHLHRKGSRFYMDHIGGDLETYFLRRKTALEERERRLMTKLTKLQQAKDQQSAARARKLQFPSVAVVGYTNSGKTSLIKYLSKDKRIEPLDQLFATLDISYHSSRLDSGQKLMLLDTIGFISNIPTGLIAAFNATLKEIINTDLILHVYDASHPDLEMQKHTVKHTLSKVIELPQNLLTTKLEIGNKIDNLEKSKLKQLMEDNPNDTFVSLKNLVNVDCLKQVIEERVQSNVGHQEKLVRVRAGGPEYSWLVNNVVIKDTNTDLKNENFYVMKVMMTETQMAKFKKQFIKKSH